MYYVRFHMLVPSHLKQGGWGVSKYEMTGQKKFKDLKLTKLYFLY